jgi:phosphoribosylformimino-5-aminoimidazole carboxamide ribotide isomerase
VARAQRLLEFSESAVSLQRIIVGLESVRDLDHLAAIRQLVGPSRAVFSIDLRQRRPMSDAGCWQDRNPLEIAAAAIESGFRRLILLDLTRVGLGAGPALADDCRSIRDAFPDVELVSGGGVRDHTDIVTLTAAGCDAVLVASALHDGSLGQETCSRNVSATNTGGHSSKWFLKPPCDWRS